MEDLLSKIHFNFIFECSFWVRIGLLLDQAARRSCMMPRNSPAIGRLMAVLSAHKPDIDDFRVYFLTHWATRDCVLEGWSFSGRFCGEEGGFWGLRGWLEGMPSNSTIRLNQRIPTAPIKAIRLMKTLEISIVVYNSSRSIRFCVQMDFSATVQLVPASTAGTNSWETGPLWRPSQHLRKFYHIVLVTLDSVCTHNNRSSSIIVYGWS